MNNLKSAVFLVLSSFLLLQCSTDACFEKSLGTKLVSIEHSQLDRTWLENYTYILDNQVGMIENLRSLGTRYEMEFDGTRLIECLIFRISDGKLHHRDSVAYRPDGKIDLVYQFSDNVGEGMALRSIVEYEYNEENKVSQTISRPTSSTYKTYINKYYWEENNVVKIDYYFGDGGLRYEFFYEYDKQRNYLLANPRSLLNPLSTSENNIVKMNAKDYTGLLDLLCNPCFTEYRYNANGFPVRISGTNSEMRLNYE